MENPPMKKGKSAILFFIIKCTKACRTIIKAKIIFHLNIFEERENFERIKYMDERTPQH